MTKKDLWTIGQLLQWTDTYFREKGCPSPRLDAEVLLAEACGCERIELYTRHGEHASEKAQTAFRELVHRRAAGAPVAYLVGHREFYSLSFRVTPDVLIPRPETEFVVVSLLDLVKQITPPDRPLELVDVGTGSGILAICAAQFVPACRVTAVDISPAALEVARRNAGDHGVSDRIDFIQGDLLDCLPPDQRFDFVISNPPYVSRAEWDQLADDIKEYEPVVALVAGDRPEQVVDRLVSQASGRLKPGGWLVVEISPMIEAKVNGMLNANPDLDAIETKNDLAGHARIVLAQRVGS